MRTATDSTRMKLGVIIGSTRENRFATTVAKWFLDQASGMDGIDIDVIDVADATSPAMRMAKGEPDSREFVARLDAADAFVVITPEYNHGYPGPLKVAIDAAHREWQAKPVGFVSYGGISGGLRAVEQLRQVFAELHSVTVRDTVSFHGASDRFGPDGQPYDVEGSSLAAKTMLDQITWWAHALGEARAARPYAG